MSDLDAFLAAAPDAGVLTARILIGDRRKSANPVAVGEADGVRVFASWRDSVTLDLHDRVCTETLTDHASRDDAIAAAVDAVLRDMGIDARVAIVIRNHGHETGVSAQFRGGPRHAVHAWSQDTKSSRDDAIARAVEALLAWWAAHEPNVLAAQLHGDLAYATETEDVPL